MQVIYVFSRAIILVFQINTQQKKFLENSRRQIFLRAELKIVSIADSLKRRNMEHRVWKAHKWRVCVLLNTWFTTNDLVNAKMMH